AMAANLARALAAAHDGDDPVPVSVKPKRAEGLGAIGRAEGIAAWAVALLIIREITVTALRSIASSEGLVIAAGEGGKAKTALQMIGIICLILGYPYRVHGLFHDFGVLDLVHVGRLLVYTSLFFSLTSALTYIGLFAEAVDVKNRGR
ncbi:MAG TPA: CDP-alcohol phosphatidyltransferase family protein, partial [Polyangiaceae bacterium]|nr:CDP-alcohol phosphatidyltransferase family protein [Polyangiaceae bacterium]